MTGQNQSRELRRLPSVERLAGLIVDAPRHLAVGAARAELAAVRAAIRAGGSVPSEDELAAAVGRRAARMATPSLRRVINATGVVLHTNLGRAPLPPAAVANVASVAAGYSNLEYDLERGQRGSRGEHLEGLLVDLTGAEAALAANNNAAAVMLALAALAGDGEVLVSRGELVEIGGSFRIPDILAHSGATLVEVGTTNRTRLADYEAAIGRRTTAILRVHQSNFRIVGFTEQAQAAELAGLAHRRGLAMVDDLGSGALEDIHGEPTVRTAVAAGADVVCCSGDKLLGGPQAGIVVGKKAVVGRLKKNPWNRALRIDKFTIAALEATLTAYEAGVARDTVPTLRLLTEPLGSIIARGRRVLRGLGPDVVDRLAARLGEGRSQVGGGALPTVELPTAGLVLGVSDADARALDATLRAGDPAVLGRLVDDRLFLDCRTVLPGQVAGLVKAVVAAVRS
jgi:L-seryl-tRNA(Ser) seleniumtransferase